MVSIQFTTKGKWRNIVIVTIRNVWKFTIKSTRIEYGLRYWDFVLSYSITCTEKLLFLFSSSRYTNWTYMYVCIILKRGSFLCLKFHKGIVGCIYSIYFTFYILLVHIIYKHYFDAPQKWNTIMRTQHK